MAEFVYNDPGNCEHEWGPIEALTLEEERRRHKANVNSYVFEYWRKRVCKKCKAIWDFSTFEMA